MGKIEIVDDKEYFNKSGIKRKKEWLRKVKSIVGLNSKVSCGSTHYHLEDIYSVILKEDVK